MILSPENPFDGVLVIDKPEGPSSHDICACARRITKIRKVGHLGTLDPAASGVLPLALGAATRRAAELAGHRKVYEFTLVLGSATDTDDAAGVQTASAAVTPEMLERLPQILGQFTGTILQRPPAYSAVKVQGRRAYQLARQGEDVEVEPRPVTIDALHIIDEGEAPSRLRMRMECRTGTYVRSLCRDLGAVLGCGGHASGIRRLQSGAFRIEQAVTLQEFLASPEAWRRSAMDLETILKTKS